MEDVSRKPFKRKQWLPKYDNISAKKLPPLSNKEVVFAKPENKSGRWYKARVEKQVDVRSYDVRTEDGRVLRRNRRHLRSGQEPVYSVATLCLSVCKRECKNICGAQFSRYLFSARSYMVNYVYYLVCLCFGIFGVKYFLYSYISALFIRIRPSGLWTPNNPQSDFILLLSVSQLIGKIVCFVF